MSEKKYLKLYFNTDANKIYSLTVNNISRNIESKIPAVMDEIISTNIITTNSGVLVSKKNAKIYNIMTIPIEI